MVRGMSTTLLPIAVTLSALVGAGLPLLTAVIQQPGWSTRTKQYVAVAVAVVAGVATAAADGNLTHPANLAAGVAAVIAAAEAAYRVLWQPSGVAPAIESATSPSVTVGDESDADVDGGV